MNFSLQSLIQEYTLQALISSHLNYLTEQKKDTFGLLMNLEMIHIIKETCAHQMYMQIQSKI